MNVNLFQKIKNYYHRAQSSKEWDKLIKSENWLILDTETTGTDKTSQIIEIGIIDPYGHVLMNQRIRPIGISRMPAQAKKVHGIGIPDLKDSPYFADIVQEFMAIISNKTILCYNADFDYRLLMQTAEANDMRIGLNNFSCVMKRYAEYVGEWDDYRKSYKWQKLPGGTHGAIGDCNATLAVIVRMATLKR
tara:strand:- start:262 stop:834 length:573 start_codon:yes stop_codon:yes gene_type:complete